MKDAWPLGFWTHSPHVSELFLAVSRRWCTMPCEATARVESVARARTRTDFIVEWRDTVGENEAVRGLIPFFIQSFCLYMLFMRGVAHDGRLLSVLDLFLAHPLPQRNTLVAWLSFGSLDVAAPP